MNGKARFEVTDMPVGGKLGLIAGNWSILADPFMIQLLQQGYLLPLTSPPPTTFQALQRAYLATNYQRLWTL